MSRRPDAGLQLPADDSAAVHLPALISAAERALAKARTFEEVKKARAQAESLKTYAQAVGAGQEAQNRWAEYVLRAERRLGLELAKIEKAKGAREPGTNRGATRSQVATASKPKLAEIGVTKTESARCQAIASIPEARFESYLANTEKISTAGALRDLETDLKSARRRERERALGEQTRAAASKLSVKIFGVIYADPPWKFHAWSAEKGLNRGPASHYPTMELDDIKGLEIPAASDAVLYLWASVGTLAEALDVMQAWGFGYRSHFVWVMPHIAKGHWARNRHEVLLIGVRGKVPAPAPGTQYESVIEAPPGRHSEKPAVFAEMIEKTFPTLPKLEMFARKRRKGWDAWGNEADG